MRSTASRSAASRCAPRADEGGRSCGGPLPDGRRVEGDARKTGNPGDILRVAVFHPAQLFGVRRGRTAAARAARRGLHPAQCRSDRAYPAAAHGFAGWRRQAGRRSHSRGRVSILARHALSKRRQRRVCHLRAAIRLARRAVRSEGRRRGCRPRPRPSRDGPAPPRGRDRGRNSRAGAERGGAGHRRRTKSKGRHRSGRQGRSEAVPGRRVRHRPQAVRAHRGRATPGAG